MGSSIDLGFITIHFYSLILLLAIILASIIIINEAKKNNYKEDFIWNLIFWTVLCGIIGARLYFVIFNLDYYLNNLLEIFMVWHGGLAIHGGIIGGLLAIFYHCHKNKIKTIKILDIFVVGLILAQAIGRWGNFFNAEAHGPVTTLTYLNNLHLPDFIIEGMYINGNYYIPTFLYESLWCLLGFIILLIVKRKTKISGITTSLYLIWYGIGRFFIESLRTDSLMIFNFKMAQIISLLMIVVGIIIYIISIKERKINNEG